MRAPLTLSTTAAEIVHDEVARFGARGVETGAFLLTGRDGCGVTSVALPGMRGVARRRDTFAVSGRTLAKLFRYASARNLLIGAQVHSHRGEAFLSRTDLRHGFSVEGFVTAIVPHYIAPPTDPAAWCWWRYTAGDWALSAPPVADGKRATGVVIFDEEGARAT